MALRLFDVHAHYEDERYDEDRDELFIKMKEDGVVGIINSGDSVRSSERCIKTAEKYDYVYASAGIHPLNIEGTTHQDIEDIRKMLSHPKVIAVGEIGLDYYYKDTAPKETQIYWLTEQIKLAGEFKKPIVFHDRDAHEDTLKILKKTAKEGITGIVHCFSGSVEMMREIVKYGYSISVGGVVTFKNARKIIEVIKELPSDRLLLETDAPYLAPVPFRGKRNYSSLIKYTAEAIADIRGVSPEEISNISCGNCIRIFGV